MYAKLACYTCYKSVISRNLIECSLSYSNSVICNNISVVDAEILKTLSHIFWICMYCFNIAFPFVIINDYKLYET